MSVLPSFPVAGDAVDGLGQPFPLLVDPLALGVVLKERLSELHGVVADDRADRGPVRCALFEQTGEVLQNSSRYSCPCVLSEYILRGGPFSDGTFSTSTRPFCSNLTSSA